MKKTIKQLFESLNNLDEDKKEKILFNIFNVKDINSIDSDTYLIIYSFLYPFIYYASDNKDNVDTEVKIAALLIAQMLSVTGLLKDGNAVPDEEILNYKSVNNNVSEDWLEDLVQNYLAKIEKEDKINNFINDITKLSDDSALLTAATNFVFYHTKQDINEDELVTKDLALINTIRLSFINNINKEVKDLLQKHFDIDVTDFIKEHIDLLFK